MKEALERLSLTVQKATEIASIISSLRTLDNLDLTSHGYSETNFNSWESYPGFGNRERITQFEAWINYSNKNNLDFFKITYIEPESQILFVESPLWVDYVRSGDDNPPISVANLELLNQFRLRINNILGDPISKGFYFHYHVVGSTFCFFDGTSEQITLWKDKGLFIVLCATQNEPEFKISLQTVSETSIDLMMYVPMSLEEFQQSSSSDDWIYPAEKISTLLTENSRRRP